MFGNTLVLLLMMVTSYPEEQRLLRFIGNSGFEISDGQNIILIDFPYKSGAYGYMTFKTSEIHKRRNSLCLFTHRHADHFNQEDLSAIGCVVAGPSEVLTEVESSQHLGDGSPWKFRGALISCIQSEHGDVEHCSYSIHWHNTTFVVAGDVESLQPVLKRVTEIDFLLVPYWLSGELHQVRKRYPKAKIIVSHQESGDRNELCKGCLRLEQGGSVDW